MNSYGNRKRNKHVTILVTPEEHKMLLEVKKETKINIVDMLLMKARELSEREGECNGES